MYMRYSTVLPRNFLCHIMDILQTLMTERCHGIFYGFTYLLRNHGSAIKSRNFPGFPDDHGIIMESRNSHGFKNYGKFRKFGNVRSIVDKTRINPCIVKIYHENVTELSRRIHRTSRGS